MIIISIIGTSDALLLDIFTQILIAPLATSLHLGYSKEDIELTLKDDLKTVNENAKSGVIRYGDESAWDRTSTEDAGKDDWKNNNAVKIVTGLAKSTLKNLSCHIPTSIL